MSLAYKVEELLALRDSVSESAVSIDKFADEDVIKEHVLRPSASASAHLASRESNSTLQVPVAPTAIAPPPLKRPSPSPSIKRGKAEKLLKEHGSPPGMRVTAGGRIVPSDLPQLGTSRFNDITYKPQNLRVVSGSVMSAQPPLNTNSAARIEVIGGQPVVFVGDRMFALPAVNAINSPMPSGGASTTNSSAKHISDPAIMAAHSALPEAVRGPPRANTKTPFAGLDIAALLAQQTLKKQELRTVEKTEVLQASHQSEAWRANMIEKKRSLIVELDSIRKQISTLENDNTSNKPNSFGTVAEVAGPASVSTFVPQFQQPLPQPMYTFHAANPYAPLMIYPPSFGGYPGFPTTETAQFVSVANNPHSPGSGSRRSHAVEIKAPREDVKKDITSGLNPKSPTYEPTSKPLANSIQMIDPPTPSPPKRSPLQEQHNSKLDRRENRNSSQKPSLSSIDTTDFFPTNTHEHSSTRVAPLTNNVKQTTNENITGPYTPEKHWPASPWNECNSDQSRKHEPMSKLSSWPESFGTQPSFSSLRQPAPVQSSSAFLERTPVIGGDTSRTASSKNLPLRTNSERCTAAEENWPFSSKAAMHVPSTYQEGYQAGYDHVGMPDSPEVLQGYIQGLLQFLSDESKKRHVGSLACDVYTRGVDIHTPSLRGLVAGSTPHDSAVSMSFNRNSTLNGGQENTRSAKMNLMAEVCRDPAYSPYGSIRGAPLTSALSEEAPKDIRQRIPSNMKFLSSEGLVSDRIAFGQRQVALPTNENDTGKTIQDKGNAYRSDTVTINGAFQQSFGNQIHNRGHGTPLSMQRFHPNLKETNHGGSEADNARARPLANHSLSGLDGAMDDLAEMINDTHVEDNRVSAGHEFAEGLVPVETEEVTASCFKPSTSKGKQKAAFSPSRAMNAEREKTAPSSPNTHNSPKKSGEQSPAKVKLEQVTNKFRRVKKDDVRTMSPEDRTKRSEKWRQRFQQLKRTEMEEIEAYTKNNRT